MEKIISNFIGINPKVSFEDIKKSTCPQIVLNGWWWKKYVPYYKNIRTVMQELSDYNWMNGGYEEYQKTFKEMIETFLDKDAFDTFNNGFKTHL